ncbi:MAG: HoxN/HupN/NixA family nickel/cobalt transporter [Leucobacter sp.]
MSGGEAVVAETAAQAAPAAGEGRSPAARRVGMIAVIAVLFAAGIGLAAASQFPGNGALSLALCLTAAGLGARHALDIDHIAAIDTTTRAFLARGTRTESIGFWFALGHSTIVVGAVGLLCLGFGAFAGQLGDEGSALHAFTGVWGPAVAGLFLILAAALNTAPLRRAFGVLRSGADPETRTDGMPTGLLGRVLRPAVERVVHPSQMYTVGFLFGLGFDTASTIGLLALGGAAAVQTPGWTVLALPLLFTAGMVAVDTADGMVMQRAYAWSRGGAARRAGYDFAITLVSVSVALLVGALSLLDAARTLLGDRSSSLAWLDAIDLTFAGPAVVLVLLAIWGGAALLRRSIPANSR